MFSESSTRSLRKGRLLIHVHAVEGMTRQGTSTQKGVLIHSDPKGYYLKFLFAQPESIEYTRVEKRMTRRITHTGKSLESETFDYGEVDNQTIIELYFYDEGEEDGHSLPIGALFLRVIDVLRFHNNLSQQESTGSGDLPDTSSTKINSWFTIAPAGRAHLTIDFSKASQQAIIQFIY